MLDWLSTKIDNLVAFIRAYFLSLLSGFSKYILDIWEAFKFFIVGIWEDTRDFISDLFVKIIESVLDAISYVFSSIPAPDFLNGGLNSLFSVFPDSVIYLLSQSGFFPALAVYGSGVAFRLLRKVFTLGQW